MGADEGFNRSRSWVEEEGEVFRRGTILLGPEEMEGEYAGEELRKEVFQFPSFSKPLLNRSTNLSF